MRTPRWKPLTADHPEQLRLRLPHGFRIAVDTTRSEAWFLVDIHAGPVAPPEWLILTSEAPGRDALDRLITNLQETIDAARRAREAM